MDVLKVGHSVHLLFPRACCQASRRAERVLGSHSMTSSARARTEFGTVIPSAFAVLRLITRSNFVGCSTGKSLGLVPLERVAVLTSDAHAGLQDHRRWP